MPSAPAEPNARMFRRARNAQVTTASSRNANIAARSAPEKCSTVPKKRHMPVIATAVASPAAATVSRSSACWPRSTVRAPAARRRAARHSMNAAASAAAAQTAAASQMAGHERRHLLDRPHQVTPPSACNSFRVSAALAAAAHWRAARSLRVANSGVASAACTFRRSHSLRGAALL